MEYYMSQDLIDAFTSIQEEQAINIANEMLASGTDPLRVIEVCQEAVRIIGERFESGEVFLPELIMAGEIMSSISAVVMPKIKTEGERKSNGVVLFGTVQGDIHDIGKDIVVFLLEANSFEVVDLGVDVPPSTFVDKIREIQAPVVGLSGLLSLAFDSMKETIEAIEGAGLRKDVKIMIGGGPVDETVCKYSGADAWGVNAMSAVTLAGNWTKRNDQ
jgi:5-methyltetrahydrofolate--homocysteine methyltransferase